MEFAIFGAKKSLKTLVIPARDGCAEVENFIDALAVTTARPERNDRAVLLIARLSGESSNNSPVDNRSFAAVVANGRAAVAAPVGAKTK